MRFTFEQKGLALIILAIGFVSAFFIYQFPSAFSATNSNFVEKIGEGFMASACGSSGAPVTCSGSSPNVAFNWVADNPDFAGGNSVAISITGIGVIASGLPIPSGSYIWTGGASNTTYNYSITYHSADFGSNHLLNSGTFTTPNCAPIDLTSSLNSPGSLNPGPVTFSGSVTNIGAGANASSFRNLFYIDINNNNPSPDRLAGGWHFDETSGTTASDFSGSGINGTLVNMEPADWTVGKVNGGLDFDGVNERVYLGSNLDIVRNKSAVTLAAWVRRESILAGWLDHVVNFSNNGGTGSRASLFLASSGNVRVIARSADTDAEQIVATISSPIALNTWYHVAAVIDYAADFISLYVNGALVTSGSVNFSRNTTADTPSFGGAIGASSFNPVKYFDGQIDEVYVYGRALNSSEIAQLYNDTIGRDYALTPIPMIAAGALAPSGSQSVTSGTWDAELGTHKISLCADQPNPVETEINETNNCATQTFTVGALNQPPVAIATISTDGVNYSDSVMVMQSVPTRIYLAASSAAGASSDPDGWGDITDNGKCEWNADLNQGAPTFEAPQTVNNPASASACNKNNVQLDVYDGNPDGFLTFNDAPGLKTYQVLRINDGTADSNIDTVQVNVTAQPPPTVDMVARSDPGGSYSDGPIYVNYGGTATLKWCKPSPISSPPIACAYAVSCTASGAWSGAKSASGGTQSTGPLTAPATYTLTCLNSLGVSRQDSVQVVIPDYSLSANPTSIFATIKGSGPAKSTDAIISVTPLNGFNSTVSLSSNASTVISGATDSFVPSSLSSPYSSGSTFNVTVPASATAGAYTITITGTGGGLPPRTTTVTLNVALKDPSFKEVIRPIYEAFASFISPFIQTSNASL